MSHEVIRAQSPRTGFPLVESTDVPAALIAADAQLVHWNSAFELLTGHRREALNTLAWEQLVLAESLPDTLERALLAIATRTVFAGDLLCRRANGAPFWCDVTLVPVPAREGDPATVLALFRDITARRVAESALASPATQDRFVLDRVQAGIVVHAASTEILYANTKASELLGITYDRILGVASADPRWVFFDEHGALLPLEGFPVSRAIATGDVVHDLVIGMRRPTDDAMIWALCNAYPVRNVHGDLSEIVVSFTEITKLKEAERALLASEQRLRLVFEATRDAVWDLDLTTDTTYHSARYLEMLGYEEGERRITWGVWESMIHPDDQESVRHRMAQLLQSRAATFEIEYRMMHKAGHAVQILSYGLILRDDHGVPVRMAGTNADVTAKRALESRLRQSQKLESVGQLAGGVAHDFNNLLAIISGNLELVQEDDVPPDERAQLVQEAYAAAGRGAELTRRLLTFSRQQPLRLDAVEVEPLLNGYVTVLRRLIRESIDIETRVAPALPPIKADAGLLETALLNLAINARDAISDGGCIRMHADVVHISADTPAVSAELTPGDYVRISVTDSGSGMTKEVMERAVEPFFTTKSVGQGTGLGLSMVYGFVRQCGGGLLLRSTPNTGTSVQLFFPAQRRTSGTPIDSPRIPVARRQHDQVILVVEDDPSVRKLCIRELTALGYQTLEARDGPSALTAFDRAARVDLLLTDVVMPGGLNGSEVAAALRARRPELKVVFMSGYHADILKDMLHDDTTHLLSKPFSISELGELLSALFEQPA